MNHYLEQLQQRDIERHVYQNDCNYLTPDRLKTNQEVNSNSGFATPGQACNKD